MDIYEPGSAVTIADGSIQAMISCVAVYAHGGVLYEIVWWKDGTRQEAWLSEQEIQAKTEKIKVGFKTNGGKP